MPKRFSRAFGALDVDACEEYYDSIGTRDTHNRHEQQAGNDMGNRKKNPQRRNRDRQQAREQKEARLSYFR
jgi:hypothetical protein